jgi:hypothetical protein
MKRTDTIKRTDERLRILAALGIHIRNDLSKLKFQYTVIKQCLPAMV